MSPKQNSPPTPSHHRPKHKEITHFAKGSIISKICSAQQKGGGGNYDNCNDIP